MSFTEIKVIFIPVNDLSTRYCEGQKPGDRLKSRRSPTYKLPGYKNHEERTLSELTTDGTGMYKFVENSIYLFLTLSGFSSDVLDPKRTIKKLEKWLKKSC